MQHSMLGEIVSHDPGPLAPALKWVDARFGPIRSLQGRQHDRPGAGWWIYTCEISRPLVSVFGGADVKASGASIEPSEALQRVLGEALERYIAFNSTIGAEYEMIVARDSQTACHFPRCLEDEPAPEPFKRLPLDASITHVPMRRLGSGETVWVPGVYVHLRYVPAEGEPMITERVSTGLAFHTELWLAIWLGLCEVAERDAIMTFWCNQTPIPRLRINLPAAPRSLADRLAMINRADLKVHLFDMSTDFNIPMVFSILESTHYPYFAAGAGCSADPYKACCKAIDEAMMVGNPVAVPPAESPVVSFQNFDWIERFEDHKLLYAHWQDPPALEFLLSNNKNECSLSNFANRRWWDAPSSHSELEALARDLEGQDLAVFWADLTTEDAKALGYCVRVVVPQMVPLSASHSSRWLACRRLNGKSPHIKTSAKEFNPYPHPFS